MNETETGETLHRRRLLQALAAGSALAFTGRAGASRGSVEYKQSNSLETDDAFARSGLDPEIFSEDTVELDDLSLHYVIGGDGPPLVLLHGWPETWYEWKDVMPLLADEHTVIAMDYRGAGGSDAPATGYDKRTMAADIKQAIGELGYDRVSLAGHDIGGMVGYAFASEYPEALDRFAIIDVPLPGIEPFWNTVKQIVWHFGFHAVPDLPETLVSDEVRPYLAYFYDNFAFQDVFDEEDREVYLSAYQRPEYLTAGFELYRAFATDVERNEQYAETKLDLPVLALYGEASPVSFIIDMMEAVATDVRGGAIEESGHFVPEERPEALAEELIAFFADS